MPTKIATVTLARPGWALLAAFAFASLPPWARRMYGLPGVRPVDLATSLSSRLLSRALNTLPATWRTGPHQRAAMERIARNAAATRRSNRAVVAQCTDCGVPVNHGRCALSMKRRTCGSTASPTVKASRLLARHIGAPSSDSGRLQRQRFPGSGQSTLVPASSVVNRASSVGGPPSASNAKTA